MAGMGRLAQKLFEVKIKYPLSLRKIQHKSENGIKGGRCLTWITFYNNKEYYIEYECTERVYVYVLVHGACGCMMQCQARKCQQ